MKIASSAMATARESASASEWTTTVAIPRRAQVLMIRTAISPRLAIRIFENILDWGRPNAYLGVSRAMPAIQ